MPNTNKCWDCIHCLRGKVRKGAELVTGEYGNCLSESSPLAVTRRFLKIR